MKQFFLKARRVNDININIYLQLTQFADIKVSFWEVRFIFVKN